MPDSAWIPTATAFPNSVLSSSRRRLPSPGAWQACSRREGWKRMQKEQASAETSRRAPAVPAEIFQAAHRRPYAAGRTSTETDCQTWSAGDRCATIWDIPSRRPCRQESMTWNGAPTATMVTDWVYAYPSSASSTYQQVRTIRVASLPARVLSMTSTETDCQTL